MTEPKDDPTDDTPPPAPRGTIRDRRLPPRGVLPRHLQMWLMVAISVVILAIILLTGQQTPTPRPTVGARLADPTLVSPERVRSYQEALATEAARQQQAAEPLRNPTAPTRTGATASSPSSVALFSEEQRRRESQSLFADNVAMSRRAVGRQSYAQRVTPASPTSAPASMASPDLSLLHQWLAQGLPPAPAPGPSATAGSATAPAPAPPSAPSTDPPVRPTVPTAIGPIVAGAPLSRLVEGTIIETVLLNRLDGTFAGPVTCLVTTPVYSWDRQSIVIPAGARVLGTSSPVQAWGESRLAVSFHRLVMPDGQTHRLDRFKGLGQIGDTGLTDRVNRHYWQVFGASVAIGALSGLAQLGTQTGIDGTTFGESFRQGVGASLAASTGRVLDRYLNILPTLTIREGYRIKVYLTNDLDLPTYAPASPGGVR